jgi:RNA polymerase sigma-70 factor (ECF subfamily)
MRGLPDNDKAFVEQLLQGDELAFQQFFEGMFPRIYRFALPRVDQKEDAAEEVAQATLCLAVRKLGTFRGEATLFTWLCTICRHEIHAWRNRERDRTTVELIEDVPEIRAALESLHAIELHAADAHVERRDIAALVQRVLDYLPAHYGSALEWKYLDDLSVREIAARLGMGEKAAESLLTRARRAFRDAFASVAPGLRAPGLTFGKGGVAHRG